MTSAGAADPADAYDRLRRRVLWQLPTGLYVVGSRHGDERNAMTLNLAMQASTEPKAIAIAVRTDAYTHSLIERGGAFTLNVLRRQDRTIVRKFVKPVAVDPVARTLNGFAYAEGRTGTPYLLDAWAVLDCTVAQQVRCGDHSMFVGEVVDVLLLGEEGEAILRMEDTRMNYGG